MERLIYDVGCCFDSAFGGNAMVCAVGAPWRFQYVIPSIHVLPFRHLSAISSAIFPLLVFYYWSCCLRVLLCDLVRGLRQEYGCDAGKFFEQPIIV